jgi:hypothetical protein
MTPTTTGRTEMTPTTTGRLFYCKSALRCTESRSAPADTGRTEMTPTTTGRTQMTPTNTGRTEMTPTTTGRTERTHFSGGARFSRARLGAPFLELRVSVGHRLRIDRVQFSVRLRFVFVGRVRLPFP